MQSQRKLHPTDRRAKKALHALSVTLCPILVAGRLRSLPDPSGSKAIIRLDPTIGRRTCWMVPASKTPIGMGYKRSVSGLSDSAG